MHDRDRRAYLPFFVSLAPLRTGEGTKVTMVIPFSLCVAADPAAPSADTTDPSSSAVFQRRCSASPATAPHSAEFVRPSPRPAPSWPSAAHLHSSQPSVASLPGTGSSPRAAVRDSSLPAAAAAAAGRWSALYAQRACGTSPLAEGGPAVLLCVRSAGAEACAL